MNCLNRMKIEEVGKMKVKISLVFLFLISFYPLSTFGMWLSDQVQTPSMPVANVDIPKQEEEGILVNFESLEFEDFVGNWTYYDQQRFPYTPSEEIFHISSWMGKNLDLPEGEERGGIYNLIIQTGGEEPFSEKSGLDIAGGIWIKFSEEIKQLIPKFSGLSFDVYLEVENVFDELVLELKEGDKIITQFIYPIKDLRLGEWQTLAIPVNFDAKDVEDLTLVVGLRGEYPQAQQTAFLAVDDIKLDKSDEFSFEAQQDKRSSYFTYGIYGEMVEQLESNWAGSRAAAVKYLGENVPSCRDEVIRLNVAKALKPLLDDRVTDIRVKAIEALSKLIPTLSDERYKAELVSYMTSRRFLDNREKSIRYSIVSNFYELVSSLTDEKIIINVIANLKTYGLDDREDYIKEQAFRELNSAISLLDDIKELRREAEYLKNQIAIAAAIRLKDRAEESWYTDDIREEITTLLKKLVPVLSEEGEKSVLNYLINLRRNDEDLMRRKVDLLGELLPDLKGEEIKVNVIKSIIKECGSDMEDIRVEAVKILGELIPKLEEFISEEKIDEVKRSIALALVERVKRDSQSWRIGEEASNILRNLIPSLNLKSQIEVVERLIKIVDGKVPEPKARAITILGDIASGVNSDLCLKIAESFLRRYKRREDLQEFHNQLKEAFKKVGSKVNKSSQGEILLTLSSIALGERKDEIETQKEILEILGYLTPKLEDEDKKLQIVDNIITVGEGSGLITDILEILGYMIIPSLKDENKKRNLTEFIGKYIEDERPEIQKKAIEVLAAVIPVLPDKETRLHYAQQIINQINSESIEISRAAVWAIANVLVLEIEDEQFVEKMLDRISELINDDALDKRTTACDAIGALIKKVEDENLKYRLFQSLFKGFEDEERIVRSTAWKTFKEIFNIFDDTHKTLIADMILTHLKSERAELRYNAVNGIYEYILPSITDEELEKKLVLETISLVNDVESPSSKATTVGELVREKLKRNFPQFSIVTRDAVMDRFSEQIDATASLQFKEYYISLVNRYFDKISETQKRAAVIHIINMLNDPAKDVKIEALRFFGYRFREISKEQIKGVVDGILNKLLDIDDFIRERALQILDKNFEIIPEEQKAVVTDKVVAKLSDLDSTVRGNALDFLIAHYKDYPGLNREETIEEVIARLRDVSSFNRKKVLKFIDKYFAEFPEEYKKEIIDRVISSTMDPDTGVRASAVQMLGNHLKELSEQDKLIAVDAILMAANDMEWVVSWEAKYILTKMLADLPFEKVGDVVDMLIRHKEVSILIENFDDIPFDKRTEVVSLLISCLPQKEQEREILEFIQERGDFIFYSYMSEDKIVELGDILSARYGILSKGWSVDRKLLNMVLELIKRGYQHLSSESSKITYLLNIYRTIDEIYWETEEIALKEFVDEKVLELSDQGIVELSTQVLSLESYRLKKEIRDLVERLKEVGRVECAQTIEGLLK